VLLRNEAAMDAMPSSASSDLASRFQIALEINLCDLANNMFSKDPTNHLTAGAKTWSPD
jgi:hypothetical protein